MVRTYSELVQLSTFLERFRYLALRGSVGAATFGDDRHLNQQFYRSSVWRNLRHSIIVRDFGCDLATPEYDIHSELYIHHMNPITVNQLTEGDPNVLDPDFLITTTHQTHNAIHYGDENLLPRRLVVRRSGDTKLW